MNATIWLIVAGIICLLNGVVYIIGKFKINPKDLFWDEFFKERFSEKTNRIIDIVSGIIFTLVGLYLLLKGIFDPSFSSFWIRF